MGFVASTRFCRESGFVANTRFFGFVLSRLLLRHKGFYSDFVQISAQKIGGWDLCFMVMKIQTATQTPIGKKYVKTLYELNQPVKVIASED